jgi:uncharacterized protein (DUF1778 family)
MPKKPKKLGHRAPRDSVAANVRITIRLSPREADLVIPAAERAEVSTSEYIRDAAVERARADRRRS